MFRRLGRLTMQETLDLVRGAALLAAARVRLSVCGFERAHAWAARRSGAAAAPPPGTDADRMRRAASLVAAAARRLLRRNRCLCTALAIMAHPAFRGSGAVLRLGVARGGDRAVEAHAWVEAGGMVFGEARDVGERWTPLERGGPGAPGRAE